ncbi:hypothetical protein RB594_000024 [Gaeumannomyces avenae]
MSPLAPEDARLTRHTVQVSGKTYHYLESLPVAPRGTILLLHGWPDTAWTWRHQIPALIAPPLSLRVIAPDMLGYGGTSAPDDAQEYSLKEMASHMRELVRHVLADDADKRVLLMGHDWGAALAWRMAALWTPDLLRGVVCLNVPYLPPDLGAFVDLDAYVAAIPSLRYMQQLAGDEAVSIIDDPADSHANLCGFLNGIYDGRGPNGEESFTVSDGVQKPETLRIIGPAKLMSKDWMDVYVRQFAARSFRGPTNWYRTRRVNYEDEKGVEKVPPIQLPSMVVMASGDEALPPALADGMESWFAEGMLRKEIVDGGHWAHWENVETVNGLLVEFLGGVLKV